MDIEVDLSLLNKIRQALGPERDLVTDPVELPPPQLISSLIKQLKVGVETYSLENLQLYGPYMVYRGVQVVVHPWLFGNQALETVKFRNMRQKRFHIVWCSVVDNLHRTGKLNGRLMFARRDDHYFQVGGRENGKETSSTTLFPVCRSCLSTLKLIRPWYFPHRRAIVADAFDIQQFLADTAPELSKFTPKLVGPPG